MVRKIPKEAYNYNLEFKDFQDWFISFKSPAAVWNETPTHLIIELMMYFGTFVCLIHAIRRAGRWPFLFLAPIGHGVFVEVVSYYLPDIDSFWHAQSMIVLLGRRLPLHIGFLYTVFYYHAFWAVSKLKIKCQWTEHIAVGLLGVLMDIPYDITGVRFINWTWHDTDPNLYERTYFVPWNSYMFHFFFACSMSFVMQNARKVFEKRKVDKYERGSMTSEIFALLMTTVFSMPLGALLFMVSYHILHDFLLVPTETVVVPIIGILILVVWAMDRRNNNRKEDTMQKHATFEDKLLYVHQVVHYVTLVLVHVVFNPEDHISISLHETIGNCSETKVVKTLLKDLEKRAFLCVTDYDEKYYDFNCLKELPPAGSSWYTVCGTPYENRAEYIWIMSAVAVAALVVFGTIHGKSCKSSQSIKEKTK